MTTTPGGLRTTGAPTRVADLLLPTLIGLLTRAPAGAAAFSTLQPEQEPPASTRPATHVTGHRRPAAIPQAALPAEQVNS